LHVLLTASVDEMWVLLITLSTPSVSYGHFEIGHKLKNQGWQ